MKVTTVSVKFSRRLDLGYTPYIAYLRQLAGKPAPFGTRDNSNMEYDLYISADVGEGEDAEAVAHDLLLKSREIMDQNVGYIRGTQDAPVPEDAFTVEKTEVVRVTGGF